MMCILPLLIYLHVAVIVFYTFKINNVFLRWLCVIYPAMWLFFLFIVPSDVFTYMFTWLPAFLGVCVLLVLLFIDIDKKHKNKDLPYFKARLVRPLLFLAVYVAAVSAHKYSLHCADNFAVQTAKEIQAVAEKTGQCPLTIDGWHKDRQMDNTHYSHTLFGKIGPKFILYYNSDAVDFTIQVKHNIDKVFIVKGGVDKQLRAFKVVCSTQTEVLIDD